MAKKNTGFAALTALQTKPQEQIVEPTNVTREDDKVIVHIPDLQDGVGGEQPPAIDEDAVEDSFTDPDEPELGADESTGGFDDGHDNVEVESFASSTKEADIASKLAAPATPVFDAPVETQVVDPQARVLNELPVQDWTTAELEAYIAGTVSEETYVATLKEAVKEHRIREIKLPAAWTVTECRNFLKNGIEPAKTTKGAWVSDDTRRFRREHEWTTEELESWALDEIKPEGSTSKNGLAIELKQRLGLNIPTSDPQNVIANYRFTHGKVKQEVVIPTPATIAVAAVAEPVAAPKIQLDGVTPVNQSYIDSSLAQFEAVMKPGRAITEQVGGEAQRLLRDVMLYTVRLPDPVGARSAMQYLLEYFRARRGIGQLFEDTYAFRGIPDMKGTKKEQVAHHDLLTLFLVYADPMVELRGQTDVPSLLGAIDPQYQSRVLEFFSRQ